MEERGEREGKGEKGGRGADKLLDVRKKSSIGVSNQFVAYHTDFQVALTSHHQSRVQGSSDFVMPSTSLSSHLRMSRDFCQVSLPKIPRTFVPSLSMSEGQTFEKKF